MSEQTRAPDLIQLLEMLEPIPEPIPVSMWPETAGWLWLGLAILCLATAVFYRWMKSWKKNAYRRQALLEIEAAGDDPARLAEILRRVALTTYPRRQVAALHGQDWLIFLDRAYGGRAFQNGPGACLKDAAYKPTVDQRSLEGLAPLVAQWVRDHRADAVGEI